MGEIFSTSRQVSARLGVAFWRVRYAHEAGHVPEPQRVGSNRFYAEDDIEKLETYFARRGGNKFDKDLNQ